MTEISDDPTADELIDHLREWAETRFRVASGFIHSPQVPKRQQWQERGKGQILRDLLHHLDTLAVEAGEESTPPAVPRDEDEADAERHIVGPRVTTNTPDAS